MKLEEMKRIADARTKGDGWIEFHKMCHHNWDKILKVVEAAVRSRRAMLAGVDKYWEMRKADDDLRDAVDDLEKE